MYAPTQHLQIATALLTMLFFYDIFWVFLSKHIFGKNVMVAVATGLDVPMKIQIPLLHHTLPSGQVQRCNKRARTVSAVGRVCARACVRVRSSVSDRMHSALPG